jgi:hypothetical protein
MSVFTAAQIVLGHPEPAQILLRQVDAAAGEILGDVLPVLGQLQRGADAVGKLETRGGGETKSGQHQMPDRVGRERAVGPQVVEGLVVIGPLIEAVCLHQSAQRCLGHPPAANSLGESGDCGQRRLPASEEGGDVGVDKVKHGELRQLVDVHRIAYVVDEAGVAVDGEQIGAQLAREEPGGDREVLRAGLRKDALKGLWGRHRCCHRCVTPSDWLARVCSVP